MMTLFVMTILYPSQTAIEEGCENQKLFHLQAFLTTGDLEVEVQ
jgi:hypothetical protein